MGGALLRGWLAAGFPAASLAVKEPQPSPDMAALLKENGIADQPSLGAERSRSRGKAANHGEGAG